VSEDGGQAETQASSQRARLGFALAAALVLGGLITVFLVVTGRSERTSAAPRRCLQAWNSDKYARGFGAHDAGAHSYVDVEVGYMPKEGSATVSADSHAGTCAVVFAATQLDPEVEYVGQQLVEGEWLPLSGVLEPSALEALQRAALDRANASVTPEGTLVNK
jgi:hypothetical protein